MCKILTPKEKESLAKLTKLVEGLTNKKIVLESRKDCNCCGNKKSLKENTHNFKDSDFVKPNLNKRYSVYELMHGQPARFWNEIQNNFTYEVKNATLYTKDEAEALAKKLLQPRMEKYQKDGKHYSELHTGDLYKKGILKENTYKSYMGNKGESFYIAPQGKSNGLIPQSFRLINSTNHSMIDMVFSSPEEAEKYATKKELTVIPKPKEVFNETLDQSYSDMEDLAEAIVNKYNITDIGVDAEIRNTILSIGRRSDKINRIASILNTSVGTIEVMFSDYNLTEGLMSGASKEAKQSDIDASDREYIETKQKRNKLAQKKYKKNYRELGENQKNIVNKELQESTTEKERFIGYEIKCIDSEGELKALLEYIKSNGNTGHSFGIVVDEGEDKKDFFWDGDGADRIESITPIKEKKENLKEGVWALPKDALARRKAMNFKHELQRIKNDIYDIAGSDELFDRLDGAIEELDNLIIAGKSQRNI